MRQIQDELTGKLRLSRKIVEPKEPKLTKLEIQNMLNRIAERRKQYGGKA